MPKYLILLRVTAKNAQAAVSLIRPLLRAPEIQLGAPDPCRWRTTSDADKPHHRPTPDHPPDPPKKD